MRLHAAVTEGPFRSRDRCGADRPPDLARREGAGAKSLAVADLAAAPLALAAKLGANETLDLSADPEAREAQGRVFLTCVRASGAPAGLASAIGAARRAGIVVQIGNQPAGDIPFPANQVMSKEIDLRGTFRFAWNSWMPCGSFPKARCRWKT